MQFLLVQENGTFGGQCKTSNKIILVVIEIFLRIQETDSNE